MRKLLILLACGCAVPLPPEGQFGSRDAYVKTASGASGARASEARQRLEEVDWTTARERHSIFGYRRFLEDHPESTHAAEAQRFLDGLRWAAADSAGSETAMTGYLQDEPRGAHAADAWARLSALRLEKAIASHSAPVLRAWLAENPEAAGREKALHELEEAEWRDAAGPAAWRQYLDEHPEGSHRLEAQERLRKAERDEAEVLEDEPRLRAIDAVAADKLAYERALAMLDEGRLAQVSRRGSPHAAEASRDLASLRKDRRAGELERAARMLYLPRPSLDELPEGSRERAIRLREWAVALDGARLHRMLLEVASPRAWVALAALEGARFLLAGLPAAEARVRAERELAALQPLAVDAPHLAAVAVLQAALGRGEEAMATARRAAARDPHSSPALWLDAELEREPALAAAASQALAKHAREIVDAHGAAARNGEPAALTELCAAAMEARKEGAAILRQIEEGAHETDPCALPAAEDRRAAARALAAAGTPLARAALARAAARDPDPEVRAAASAGQAAAAR